MRYGIKFVGQLALSAVCALTPGEPSWAEADGCLDFGVMLNEDGDVVFTHSLDADPAVVETKLRGNLDSMLGTGIETLVFNVACGSDVMHYPTQVGSRWGWREVEKEKSEPWSKYLPALRAAAAEGLDSVRIAGQWCRDHDLRFVPSYRINDSHYAHHPEDNPLAGRFYLEHQEMELGESPVPGDTSFARLLDFRRPAVRAYRLGVIREVIGRYGGLMDGLQVDFMRQPILFPAGHGEAEASLVTDMLRQVRGWLDEAEREHGRPMPLMVRVPPSLRACAWAGLDVASWVREGLVQVVIPAAGMTLNHDIDYASFAALESEGESVSVGMTVLPRTQFAWPMSVEPQPEDFAGVVDRQASPAQVRGAVLNAAHGGATVFEIYNVNLPLDEAARQLLTATVEPKRGDRVYAVTPAYYLDHTNTYEDRKEVPTVLEANEPVTLRLVVGESAETHGHRFLRIGMRGVGDGGANLRVSMNDEVLYDGSLDRDHTVAVTGRRSRPTRLHPPDATAYWQSAVPAGVVRAGQNTVELLMSSANARALVEVVELQLLFVDAPEGTGDLP